MFQYIAWHGGYNFASELVSEKAVGKMDPALVTVENKQNSVTGSMAGFSAGLRNRVSSSKA